MKKRPMFPVPAVPRPPAPSDLRIGANVETHQVALIFGDLMGEHTVVEFTPEQARAIGRGFLQHADIAEGKAPPVKQATARMSRRVS